MRTVVRVIDAISEWTGKTGQWFGVALVAVVAIEVIKRYVFNAPSLWTYDLSVMLGTTLYVLAFGYALLHRAHVRVDVIYTHLPNRGRAIIDILGDLILLLPLMILLTKASIGYAQYAWKIDEKIMLTGWYPPAAPLRTVIVIGFTVFGLQGIAQLIRDLYLLIRNKAYD